MTIDEYNNLITADKFYFHRVGWNDKVLYSKLGTMTHGFLKAEIENADFEDAQRLLNDFYLIEENLCTNVKKRHAEKLMLIQSETDNCLKLIKNLHSDCNARAMNASTIELSNRIFWNGLLRAQKVAFDKVNPTVRPHVVYRVNRYYHSLR